MQHKWVVCTCRPKELPGVLTVTAAGTGGLMYWLAIYPIDQIKSAMMTDSIVKSERKFPTMASAVRVSTAPGSINSHSLIAIFADIETV